MKKIIPLILVGVLVLSGLGAVALDVDSEKQNFENTQDGNRDYTHTVLIEVGTATWCPSCPASNIAWHSIYEGGNYNFEYTEMVIDKSSVASSYMNNYNLYWVPTSYFDGGQFVYPGTNTNTFYNNLDASGSRAVPDLVAELNVEWLDREQLDISLSVTNNEVEEYNGDIRVYIVELESKHWDDYNGNPYYHAFLDFAINEQLNIPAGDTHTDNIVWDKVTEGYPNLLVNNVQVILAVFGDEPHQSYSDPPSGAPFTAYYVDETIAAIPEFDNNPPDLPHIDGEIEGVAGEEYTYSFCGEDPDGDPLYYVIDWGDGSEEELIGPVPSGVCATESHNFSEQGTYIIKCKAVDVFDAESDWATLEVVMPKNQQEWFFTFLQNHPRMFPILRQLLGL